MGRTSKARITLSKERDIPLLGFLWRWKVVSTMALCKKFFTNAKIETGYRRLLKLEKAGLIRCVPDQTYRNFFWTLGKNGFLSIRDTLPPLKEEGFRSENIAHDHLVTAIHLGDFLLGKPKNVVLFSEQMLRRMHSEMLPEFLPQGDEHRPDVYWCISEGASTRVIALEVELSSKTNADYRALCEFYDHSKMDQVLWVVSSRTLLNRISTLLDESGHEERMKRHSFILLDHFKSQGWQAEVLKGKDRGKSIIQLVHNKPTTSSQPVVSSYFLNSLKSPHRSVTYKRESVF